MNRRPLGRVAREREERIVVATKIPPKNGALKRHRWDRNFYL